MCQYLLISLCFFLYIIRFISFLPHICVNYSSLLVQSILNVQNRTSHFTERWIKVVNLCLDFSIQLWTLTFHLNNNQRRCIKITSSIFELQCHGIVELWCVSVNKPPIENQLTIQVIGICRLFCYLFHSVDMSWSTIDLFRTLPHKPCSLNNN